MLISSIIMLISRLEVFMIKNIFLNDLLMFVWNVRVGYFFDNIFNYFFVV